MIGNATNILHLRPRLRPLSIRERFHVVIVGGGFSGLSVAAHLVRRGDSRLRITLLDESERIGRGIAYGTQTDEHLLNTRASEMSVLEDDTDDFLWWLRRHGRNCPEPEFVSRRSFGDYLEDKLVETSLRAAQHDIPFAAHCCARVTDVMRGEEAFLVGLDDGRSMHCDAVVLATGHPPPHDVLGRWLPRGHARWIRDPWQPPGASAAGVDDRVLIVGSGLTMVDKVLELEARGHRGAIHAVSRRGLLPRAHLRRPEPLPEDLRRSLVSDLSRCAGLGEMLRRVRRAIAAAGLRGLSWRAIVDGLRPATPMLWAGLSLADRKRFLRWLRPYWDAHRHRMSPVAAAAIAAMSKSGQLEIRAGRLCGAYGRERGIIVEQRLRGERGTRSEHYEWVINCTGRELASPPRELEQRLILRGMLTPDALGIGYTTGWNGAAVQADGSTQWLYVLGPPRRPECWESTAVPELRRQADRLAAELVEASTVVHRTRRAERSQRPPAPM